MGNITFGSFIAEKRKAHKFNLRDTAKHLNIAYGYLCDIEQSRRPAPNGDFVERISAFLNLDTPAIIRGWLFPTNTTTSVARQITG